MKIKSLLFVCCLATSSVAVVAALPACSRAVEKYDTLVDKDERCNQLWADVEAQLQRRFDLVPNLVNIVKGSAAHEEKVLKEVMEARASATQIKLSADDLTDPAKMEAFKKAQEELKGSLSRLMMVQESYPDLKANSQFHDLMIQLEGTENRILQARRDYNAGVQSFNLELRRVSGKIINPLTGKEFKARLYYSADEGAKTAPSVSF